MWGSSGGLSHYDYGLDDYLTLFLPSGLGMRGSALRISKPGVLRNASREGEAPVTGSASPVPPR